MDQGGEETSLAWLELQFRGEILGSVLKTLPPPRWSLKSTPGLPWPEKTKHSGLHSLNVPSRCSWELRPHPQVPQAAWGGNLQSTTMLSKT